MKEEIQEFEEEVRNGSAQAEDELGDVLFALINAARLYKLRPDNALEKTNRKFIRRFNHIEARARQQGRNLKEMTLEEMETLWQEAKTTEHSAPLQP